MLLSIDKTRYPLPKIIYSIAGSGLKVTADLVNGFQLDHRLKYFYKLLRTRKNIWSSICECQLATK